LWSADEVSAWREASTCGCRQPRASGGPCPHLARWNVIASGGRSTSTPPVARPKSHATQRPLEADLLHRHPLPTPSHWRRTKTAPGPQTPRAGVGVTYVRTPGPVRSCAHGRRRGHARPRRSPFVAGRLDRRGGTDARNGRLALPGPRGPRRRRDGRGPSGRGHAPGAQGRPQGPAGRAHARRIRKDPLHRGGARRLAARPPPHLCRLRHR